jgi:cytochrome c6
MRTLVQGVVLFAALCLCAGYIVSASRAVTPSQKRQEKKDSLSPEELARTKALFNEKCSRCHGEDGRGETHTGEMLGAPDFTDERWWKETKGDDRFVHSVTNGKEAMPAFGKKLSKQEIAALVTYVRRFKTQAND